MSLTEVAQVESVGRKLSAHALLKAHSPNFESLSKAQLHALCDRLLTCDSDAIVESIEFLEAETFGLWHGRARAMIARRLKHCPLSESQRTRIVRLILARLMSGRFSEQFKDQLRLALRLDREQVFDVARSCERAAREHVRRYATWILSRQVDGAPELPRRLL